MTRPLRIEFAGALYHITSRGNAQGDIYTHDEERQKYLTLLANACERFDWYCHAYCQMSNHYHLLIETNSPTLSKGMKYLNGTYTQYFNRRNRRVGHVFQGRYKAILVQKANYLLELSRYIVLNPVRARMVREAVDWPWSSDTVRDEAMAYAYLSGHYTLAEVGNWFGVSYATVSRAVKAVECKM